MRPVGVSIQRAGIEQNLKKRVREMGNKNLSKEQLLDLLKMTLEGKGKYKINWDIFTYRTVLKY